MNFEIEHSRLALRSCNENLTQIGEHTMGIIVFYFRRHASVTLHMFDENIDRKIEISHNEYFNKLTEGEKITYPYLVEVGKLLLRSEREIRKDLVRA